MQFFYNDKMPLRILDEGQFWKRQENEHTVVIRQLAPDLERSFMEALAAWELAFAQTEEVFTRYMETIIRSGNKIAPEILSQIKELVTFSLQQSQQFIQFLTQMLTESVPVKKSKVLQTVLHHMIRESEYFTGIVQALLSKNIL